MPKPLEFPESLQIVTSGDSVYFRCAEHNYWGNTTPPMAVGCRGCWGAYYWVFLGKYHTEQGEDEVLEAVMRHAAEAAEKGEYDIKLYDHPQIHIEKGEVN